MKNPNHIAELSYTLRVLRLKLKIKLTLAVPSKGLMKFLGKSVIKYITVDNHH